MKKIIVRKFSIFNGCCNGMVWSDSNTMELISYVHKTWSLGSAPED